MDINGLQVNTQLPRWSVNFAEFIVFKYLNYSITPVVYKTEKRCLVLRWGFGVGRSNGATFVFQKSKMVADSHLGHLGPVLDRHRT